MLPAGGLAYLWADVAAARPLIEVLSFEGMSGQDAAQVLDRTESAMAVVFPSTSGGERRFYLAAFGSFPNRRANFSFSFSRSWKKQRSSAGNTYWLSRDNRIALAMGSNLALVSNIDPFVEPSAVIPPQGFVEFRRAMALAGWLSGPAEYLDGFMGFIGLPIHIPAEDFFFGAARLPAGTGDDSHIWELVFKLRAASAREARAFLAPFNLAVFLFRRGVGMPEESPSGTVTFMDIVAMLFANPMEQEGEFLIMRTAAMDSATVALLFNFFSLYSSQ